MDLKWNNNDNNQVAVQEQPRAISLERGRPPHFFMDGPGRLTSALQLISAAAAVASSNESNKRSSSTPPPNHNHNDNNPATHHRGFTTGHPQLSNASSTQSLHLDDGYEDNDQGEAASATTVIKTARTIVASDSEVSNGFVKDGKRLPYVFEAYENGSRKRSSKILPVCGVCGKRFVCVTTMKRHLVTHTGEKPFSCKVCGKQYTQKGNLRVHERTHRNDRPFECNICHQKFYRKEPMQKHQWRQHGIVHFKGRPPGCLDGNEAPVMTMGPPMDVTGQDSGVLYNTIVDRIKQQSFETRGESSRHLDGPPPQIPRLPAMPQQPENLSTSPPSAVSPPPQPTQRPPITLAQLSSLTAPLPLDLKQRQLPVNTTIMPALPHQDLKKEEPKSISLTYTKDLNQPKISFARMVPESNSPPPPPTFSSTHHVTLPTMSPAAQLVSAAMAELNSKDKTKTSSPPLTALPMTTNNNHADATDNSRDDGNDNDETTDTNTTETHNPLRMKKMLAHAYQQEHARDHEDDDVDAVRHNDTTSNPDQVDSDSSSSSAGCPPATASFSSATKELVECQCKGCGHVFAVQDPYNFRCGHCGVKYTSLPTHMIADPMQCIGCCEVFPHKPALKAHQMNAPDGPDRERPFRCCKCGYGFRQKAHLQKHQWRIHRRKMEEEPASQNKQRTTSESSTGGPFTITLQDIIDRGVEHSMSRRGAVENPQTPPSGENSQPLDLSPTKSLLLSSPSPLKVSSPDGATSPSASSIMLSSGGGLATDAKLRQLASSLPALHNQNQPLPMVITERDASTEEQPQWKRQRTEATSHASLPPIAGLQKPSWRSPGSGPPSPNADNLAKNKYLREQMVGGLRPAADVRTV